MLQAKSEKEQREEIQSMKLYQDQRNLAEFGVSNALEGNYVVTVGTVNCDYQSWKEFVFAQLMRMGQKNFCRFTGENPDELYEDFCTDDYEETSDPNGEWWFDLAKYFNAMEAEQ